MANMVDYLAWRGDIPFDVSPWCPVDALLAATLSYLNFYGVESPEGWTLAETKRIGLLKPGNSGAFEGRKAMYEAMADSARFRDSRIHHFIALSDEREAMQFSAMCIDLPDGTLCVAFRGTDNTLVGWREDFNMMYLAAIPGQVAARYYLERAAELDSRPIRVVGHSKGGNLAVYAAACVPPEVQDRIENVYTFDGPGMSPEVFDSEGYRRIRPKLRSFVPQTSIIGMLMEYCRDYTVVRSDATGINQHEPLSWQVYGPRFEEREEIDRNAQTIRETLQEWLENSTPDQREAFVDTLFQMVDNTKATTLSEILNEKLRTVVTMLGSSREVEPETRKIFTRLTAQFVTLGVGNVLDRVKNRLPGVGDDEDGDDKNGVDNPS